MHLCCFENTSSNGHPYIDSFSNCMTEFFPLKGSKDVTLVKEMALGDFYKLKFKYSFRIHPREHFKKLYEVDEVYFTDEVSLCLKNFPCYKFWILIC